MATFCRDVKLGMENCGAVIGLNGLILLIPSRESELRSSGADITLDRCADGIQGICDEIGYLQIHR